MSGNDLNALLASVANSEFLELDSLEFNISLRVVFNGFPIRISSNGVGGYLGEIEDTDHKAVFEVGFNPETKKAQLAWENGPPQSIDLQIAVDTIVGLIAVVLTSGAAAASLPKMRSSREEEVH